MSKNKVTVGILVILAILVIGVGYALNTTELKINGTLSAKADDANFNVKFTEASVFLKDVASTTITPTTSAEVTSDLLATFNVTDVTAVNDTIVFKYTVKNESADLSASVKVETAGTFANSNYFSVDAKFGTSDITTIEAGQTADLTVTVKCIKTPISDVEAKTTEGIVKLTATAVEKN